MLHAVPREEARRSLSAALCAGTHRESHVADGTLATVGVPLIPTCEPPPADDLVSRQRELLLEALRPLVPADGRYALLDYPAHANVGDSAIWLGALEAFRLLGAGRPAYTCCVSTYHAGVLRRRVGSGPIFLSGGGNLGDLYPHHQKLRERAARDFPDRAIVQLPQAIHFDRTDTQAVAREVFGAHPNLTLFVRDRQSLARALDGLGVHAHLAPDMAFALPRPARPAASTQDVVWLLRGDDEVRGAALSLPAGGSTVDWMAESQGGLVGYQRRLTRHVHAKPSRRLLAHLLRRTYTPTAQRRLDRGIELLASGRLVVTDRLHGHVLCVLLGIPHVLLDNRYGKNRALYEAWTHDVPFVRWAERDEGAVADALEDLRR